MKISKAIGAIAMICAIVLLQSCYPKGAEFVDELDLVTTVYDDTYNFGSKVTYAINDDIPLIGKTPPENVSGATATVILNKIKANMEARGYELISADEDPDIHILVGVLEVKTTVVGCGGGGWWGWYPGYPGYPGYGGCWYPVGYSYSTGTIFITLWDKDSLPETETDPISAQWVVGINGLLQGSQSSINTRIQNTIDQAFDQSPYIQSN